MASSKEEIITKIMKLMELGNAEKNSNPHEREAASRKAAKLMAEYAINFAELRSSKPSENAFVIYDVDGSEERKVDFESSLAGSIARAFDCKVINSYRETGKWKILFVGTKHDLEISVYFFKYLRRTMYAMATKNVTGESLRRTSSLRISAVDLRQARRNYCFGIVETVAKRMADLYAKREEHIPSDCKALVVVKKQDLDKFYAEQFPNIIHARRVTLRGDVNSFYKGKEDGNRLNLNRPISSREQSAQLG